MATQETPLPYKIFKLFNNKQWQEFYEKYLAHIYRHCNSAETVKQYQYVLRSFFSANLHPNPNDYEPHEIEEFCAHLDRRKGHEGKPPSARTYNNRLGILKSFYGYAAQYRTPFRNTKRPILHKGNPTAGVDTLVEEQVNRTLTEDEVRLIFSVIPTNTVRGLRDRAIARFYLLTGRRREEIARLTWRDLEYRHGQWIYHFKGKGRRGRDDSDILPPTVKQALDAYLTASGRLDTMQPGDPLFLPLRNREEKRGLTGAGIEKMLKRYAKLAGVHFTCHWFRHTHAYDFWRETDKNIMKVSKRLRHKSIEHTRRYLEAAEVMEAPELAMLESKYGNM